jgi:glycyl-tRNA synthetase beta chain
MPEFFLELFSEEIPARMQARAAEALEALIRTRLEAIKPAAVATWYGPRRIAVAAEVAGEVPATSTEERGPRTSAPEQALDGFLRKHGAHRDQLRREGDYWVLHKTAAALSARTVIAAAMPDLLRGFPWPKSMRWGGTSAFTWVRPLRRICAILDGETIPFDLRDGADDGHGLAAGNLTEGHRFLAPAAFAVTGAAQWAESLRAAHVMADAAERRRAIAEGFATLAAAHGLTIAEDAGLLDEVVNLVEWPVPLLGRIDAAFMDLPAEVMQVSMRVNQRYFALRRPDGSAAPWFGFVANILASDGGAAIVAGNERVLRARFADARYFWDLDRQTRLDQRIAALDRITFHAKLGSQGERVQRMVRLARHLAPLVGADPATAERAALLAKADLTTGMVGEFPELQGVMGGYYAAHDGEAPAVAAAIREHYAPKGPSDRAPDKPVAIATALADKIDSVAAFFAADEQPTGSGDPFALRRSALGIIRIIRENRLRLGLLAAIGVTLDALGKRFAGTAVAPEVFAFIIDRLRVQLRAEGARHDVLAAVFAAGADDDLTRLLGRTDAVAALLAQPDGANLLAAYRRAANILRIEDRRDGPHAGAPDPALFELAAERALATALDHAEPRIEAALDAEDFPGAMADMAGLRATIDAFFESVTVNAAAAELRRNRLRLLRRITGCMDRVADFSKIES